MFASLLIVIGLTFQPVESTADTSARAATVKVDPLTLGHLRVTVELLEREGLNDVDAKRWTGVLATWLRNDGRPDGNSMEQASLTLISMLNDEAVSYPKLNALCKYVPECFRYLAIGGGIDLDKIEHVIRTRRWETHNALAKMFAVANNEHGVSTEIYSMMREAMALPSGFPPPK